MTDDKRVSPVERKRLLAKAAYAKSKAEREHVLLRLRPGSLARIDLARASLGMTRSAYIESLLDTENGPKPTACAAPKKAGTIAAKVGDEFEALFGVGA